MPGLEAERDGVSKPFDGPLSVAGLHRRRGRQAGTDGLTAPPYYEPHRRWRLRLGKWLRPRLVRLVRLWALVIQKVGAGAVQSMGELAATPRVILP